MEHELTLGNIMGRLGGVVLLVLAIVALIVILWSVKRRKRPHLVLEETGIDDLMPSIAGVTR